MGGDPGAPGESPGGEATANRKRSRPASRNPVVRALQPVDPQHRPVTTRIRQPAYQCKPANRYGKFTQCFHAVAAVVDPVIEREVLNALTPASIQAALSVINESLADQEAIRRSRRRHLRLTEDAVDEARRRYLAVDPKNDLVKADLEQKYQSAMKTYKELELQLRVDTPVHPPQLSPADVDELVRLAQEIPTLWHAPTTTNEDRKQLIQTVISRVVIHQKIDEAIDLEIEWVDGRRQPLRILRPSGVDQLVAELHAAGTTTVDAIF